MTSLPHPYEHQVAGHHLALYSHPIDTSKLLKLSTHTEKDFYTRLGPQIFLSDGVTKFMDIWAPRFYGTMLLRERLGEVGEVMGPEDGEESVGDEMLVLENLTHTFVKPNIINLKLGTQTWIQGASKEKRERMEKTARETTSAFFGIKISKFKLWNPLTSRYDQISYTLGKSIPPTCRPSLNAALAQFFLLNHFETNDSFGDPASFPHPVQPPPREVLLEIISRVHQLENELAHLEIRIRGGDLLIVFEGDEKVRKDRLEKGQWPLEVRMIDFAHVREVDKEGGEEGPDEGLLKGLKNLREILEEFV